MRSCSPIAALLTAAAVLCAAAQTKQERITGDVVPGATWRQTLPESVGYSSGKLEALRGWLKTQDSGSMLVVVQGRHGRKRLLRRKVQLVSSHWVVA